MKKKLYLIIMVMTLGVSLPAVAQEDAGVPMPVRQDTLQMLQQQLEALRDKLYRDSVQAAYEKRQTALWGKSKPFMLAYANQSLTDCDMVGTPKYKSGIAVSFSKRRTFYLHQKAIGGMMKFGLDVVWMDVSWARYAKGKGVFAGIKSTVNNFMGNTADGTYANADDYFNKADNNANRYGGSGDFPLGDLDMGKMQVSLGVLGIGPSVRISPFYPIGKPGLDKIKLTLYAHYQPTATGVIFTGDNTFFSGGYVGMWRYGASIAYHRWGIGFEHQWGSGKLHTWNRDDDDDEFSGHSGKRKFDFSSTRFYIAVRL